MGTKKNLRSPLKEKESTAIMVFLGMEAFLIFVMPLISKYIGWHYNKWAYSVFAGFLFVLSAISTELRQPEDVVVGEKDSTPITPKSPHNKLAPAQQRKKLVVAKTLSDIAGYKTTKESLAFVVECLKNERLLRGVGAKIPAGILLYGPAGTGKTLIASAVAGSAGVPFYSVNASEFINRYVGTGPAAIRNLYQKARETTPCIVFIDELDAIGGKRSDEDNREYRSTINALLSELDGIRGDSGILTIAATNRLEDLDPALIRPGRFDRKIAVPLPNADDRAAILAVYVKDKPLAADVDLAQLAQDTDGYSGAALATLLNEAAIYAASRNSKSVSRADIDKAMFRAATGGEETESQSREELRVTAWHEAGHAICMKLLCDRVVSRITIIGSTGGTNGITQSAEKTSRATISKRGMENLIKAVYGGRAAEEILFGNTDDITASAAGDIKQATSMIREYITVYGMGSGLLNLAVLTAGKTEPTDYIEEANSLAERLYRETVEFLTEHKPELQRLADELLAKKTLCDEEVTAILEEGKS